MRFFIANWKSNKTVSEATTWLDEFSKDLHVITPDTTVVICPSFTLLPSMSLYIKEKKLPIHLGAQDISPFDEGKYTGAVNGKQIKEFATYVIVGHSERRTFFAEDNNELLQKKIDMANACELQSIFCTPTKDSFIPTGVAFVTYEPPSSISPGTPETPENAAKCISAIKSTQQVRAVLYGGSVTQENCKNFFDTNVIDGLLIGRASLDAKEFSQLIENA
jgi:triosephosphate isomerase (TIM)